MLHPLLCCYVNVQAAVATDLTPTPDNTDAAPDGRALDPFVTASWPTNNGSALPDNPHECFAVRRWHSCSGYGCWDVDAMARDYSVALQSSQVRDESDPLESPKRTFSCIAFSPRTDILVIGARRPNDRWLFRVWAHSQELAGCEFVSLRDRYKHRVKPSRGKAKFFVLTCRGGFLRTREVATKSPIRRDTDLISHYGAEFARWNSTFIRRLRQRATSITILRGEPGTGKTTYLRYLTYKLRSSFRVYYLPLGVFPLLAQPDALDFWMSEQELYSRFRTVVMLEDAESLLMERATDNQINVSNLLNIADGFLGEVLQLHVICTVNCPLKKIDRAILRPGRLLGVREFVRMQPAQAQALAHAKGLTLRPQSHYSLAELYNSDCDPNSAAEPESLGFAQPQVRPLNPLEMAHHRRLVKALNA